MRLCFYLVVIVKKNLLLVQAVSHYGFGSQYGRRNILSKRSIGPSYDRENATKLVCVGLHLNRRELNLLKYLIAWTIKDGHTQC